MSINREIFQGKASTLEWKNAMPKLTVALIVATLTPVIVFTILIVIFLIIAVIYSLFTSGNSPTPSSSTSGLKDFFGIPIFFGTGALWCSCVQVAILGIPAAVIGWRFNLIRWWSCTIGGFFVGFLPMGGLPLIPLIVAFFANIFLNVLVGEQLHWQDLAKNGVDFDLLPAALFLGLWGAIGGFAFWLTWRFLTRPASLQRVT